ncbi:spore germination protein GerPE [Bacillus andreraoultii]|uniref:spore germination protein GerPE n=1 Tax=Bacillus andreraoultii TaxID=1499685 RepID=UPI00053AAC2F|nr:spore germination protein GerPE [Bacillus andreraoultii]
MLKRLSQVQKIDVQIITFSSHLQIGDSNTINAYSIILSSKRDQELYFGTEADDKEKDYVVFSLPLVQLPIYEQLYYKKENLCGSIYVQNVNVIGVSSSSIIHIGSNDRLFLENRRKEIRIMAEPENIEKGKEYLIENNIIKE